MFFFADVTPPAFQVIEPANGIVVNTNEVEFRGVTEWGASVASGPFGAETNEYGEWTVTLVLEPGENGAVFTATDVAGNERVERIVVTYVPPESPEVAVEPSVSVEVASAPTPAATTTTAAPTTTTTTTTILETSTGTTFADSGVERWRSLVEKHFPAEHVATAMRVMACESGGNPDAKNRTGSASGLFQHLQRYWASRAERAGYPGGDVFDPETNIAVSAWLVAFDGWGHWTCY